MKNEEGRKSRGGQIELSSFIILPSAFEMSLVTSAPAKNE